MMIGSTIGPDIARHEMKVGLRCSVTVLGSGGDLAIPLALCDCRLCKEAKEDPCKGRSGPGYFVSRANALVDTSPDIRLQLVRSGISAVDAVFYSHFHPDHTLGYPWMWSLQDAQGNLTAPPVAVYIPEQVVPSFKRYLGLFEALKFAERGGVARIIEIPRGDFVVVNGVTVTPVPLLWSEACGYIFEEDERRILIIPDEVYGWEAPPSLGKLSIAVLPVGICQPHPFTGTCSLSLDHPILARNPTFFESLHQGLKINTETLVFSHIEHHDGVTHAEFAELGRILSEHFGKQILFACDNTTY